MEKTRTRTGKADGEVASAILKIALYGALYAFCGYLYGIAGLPFGAHPFGIALLAAANKNALFIFIGLAISAFSAFEGGASFLLLGIYSALLLLRVLVRLTLDAPRGKRSLGELLRMLFEEQVGYRVCSSAVAAFGLSLAVLVAGGFLYYDLFGLLICTTVAPIGTYILCKAFVSEEKSGNEKSAWARELGWGALFVVATLGARPLKVYGVSLAVACGILLVLIISQRKGFLRGILLATAIGLVYSPALCPIFLIGALAFGAFSRFSHTLVSIACFFGSLGYAFYVSGIHALDGTVGGILAACLGFSVYSRVLIDRSAGDEGAHKSERRECRVLEESELDGVRLADMNSRMAAMSESLSRLSELSDALELKFPRREEIRSICERAFDASCAGCAEYQTCRGRLIDLESARLAAMLERSGEISGSELRGSLLENCGRAGEILDEINYNYSIRCGASGREGGERLEGAEKYGYKLISSLLAKEMESDEEEYAVDLGASAALCEPLASLECGVLGVLVYGKRQRRVLLRCGRRELIEELAAKICDTVRRVAKIELDRESVTIRRCTGAEECFVQLYERRRFSLSTIVRSEACESGETSGDSVEIFENCDGVSFVCISDGMGSGRDAARVSELAVGFLKNMLVRGRASGELISMLNSFLREGCSSSAQECAATLDLLELDTLSGEAVFYKCGAAPTYVCRGDNLFKLRSRTMPLGILGSPDVKEHRMTFGDGDLVVMMSDGVSGGREDCPYLFDLLRQNSSSLGDGRTAEMIMRYAHSNPEPDDTTVILARVRGEKSEK